jgi:hypothetical protein
MSTSNLTRRGLIKNSAIAGAGFAAPTIFTASSAAAYTNEPTGGSVTLGFNVPQSGPYADEGADELRAYELAVEHLNGGGDGGMMNTFSSKELTGNGILGKKVEFVTGDTQTKSDAARASAKSMMLALSLWLVLRTQTTQLVKIRKPTASVTSLTVTCLLLHWHQCCKACTVLTVTLTT